MTKKLTDAEKLARKIARANGTWRPKSKSYRTYSYKSDTRFANWTEVTFTLAADWAFQRIPTIQSWCRENTIGNTAVSFVIGTGINTTYSVRCEKPEDATFVALAWS